MYPHDLHRHIVTFLLPFVGFEQQIICGGMRTNSLLYELYLFIYYIISYIISYHNLN